jgi:hypothetical protein
MDANLPFRRSTSASLAALAKLTDSAHLPYNQTLASE